MLELKELCILDDNSGVYEGLVDCETAGVIEKIEDLVALYDIDEDCVSLPELDILVLELYEASLLDDCEVVYEG